MFEIYSVCFPQQLNVVDKVDFQPTTGVYQVR